MIYVVGMLHVIEGILTLLFGGKNSYPIMAYKGELTAGGYEASEKWLIPLLFFWVNGIYLPVIAGILYNNESFVLSPREKAKKMGGLISGFGILVMCMAKLVEEGGISLSLGIISMPVLHELLFEIDTYIEEGKLKYPLPETGIRVMEILEKNTLGISRGDIIRKINELEVKREEDYIRAIGQEGKILVELQKMTGEQVEILCTGAELKAMKLVFLPPY